jgi:hypothetical protein
MFLFPRGCLSARERRWERVSTERLGHALPIEEGQHPVSGGTAAQGVQEDPNAEAVEFVRFCYRRRAVAWPELYDEMCAVAARGAYRGMSYEQLETLGIGFALGWLPRLAEMSARVIAEERQARVPLAVGS